MNAETWWIAAGVLATLLSTFGAWLIVNERRMGKFMTREEHERVCDRRSEAIKGSLEKIEGMLGKQEEQASEHRHKVNDTLTGVRLDVALIKQRLKLPSGEGE